MASSRPDRTRRRVKFAPPMPVGVHARRARAPEATGLPVGTLSELPNVMRESGHDPWELLESFGIRPEMMAKPLTPIPIRVHGEILQAAADATGNATIGLLLGQRAHLDNAGPVKLLVFNAKTMREAVEGLVRYVGLWYHGIRFVLTRERGFACIAVSADGKFTGRDAVLIAYLAAAVNHLEAIFGRAWRPAQIHMACRRPAQAEAYARFFRVPVLFDQPRYAIFFPDAALDAPRAGSNQGLDAFLREYLGGLESRDKPGFAGKVRRMIGDLLASGECSAARVADLFAMHRVTLHRHLRDEGTSFEALLDESRRDLALHMLEHTDVQVGEIASTLGYGASGSFVRAFSRWHGTSPGSWRRARVAR